MAKDKVTIGLTNNGKNFLETIMKLGWFSLDMEAAKFALSIAVTKKVPAGEAKGASTIWNVGSLDPDWNIKMLMAEFYDEAETPYKLAEYLIDEGLKLIVERLNKNPETSLLDFIGS